MAAVELTQENFEQEVLKAEGKVLVDFWAPWCGPCKVLDPMLTALEQELPALKVVRYNVEKDHTLPSTMGIMSVPTLVIYQQGEAREKVTGVYPKDKLKRYFEQKLEA